MARAARSFMLPVGFSQSTSANILAMRGGNTFRSCAMEVLPIACGTELPVVMALSVGASRCQLLLERIDNPQVRPQVIRARARQFFRPGRGVLFLRPVETDTET